MKKIESTNKIFNNFTQIQQNKNFRFFPRIQDCLVNGKEKAFSHWIQDKFLQFVDFIKKIFCCYKRQKMSTATIWQALNQRLNTSAPTNAIEDLIHKIKTKKIFIRPEQLGPYLSEDQLKTYLLHPEQIDNPGNTACINLLLSQQFCDKKKFCYVTEEGKILQKSTKGKVGYTADPVNPFTSIDQIKTHLKGIINGIKGSRLKRCLIPIGLKNPDDNFSHFSFVAIDLYSKNRADITIVNTHGNSLSLYRNKEEEMAQLCKELFPDPETRIQRNQDCIYTNAYSCVADGIGLMEILARQDSSFDFVAQGGISQWKLPKNYREKLGNLTREFLKSLGLKS